MKPALHIALVIPTYNEEAVIRQTILPLLQRNYTLIIVDDGSTDQTRGRLESLDIHYLRHPINLGQGAALQTGMAYAHRLGVDIVVHFDADGQHRVEDIEKLIEPIIKGDYALTLGSRFLTQESRNQVPFGRRIMLKLALILNGLLTSIWLSDAHNGFRAIHRDVYPYIHFQQSRMAHATEILSEIRRLNARYKEVPVEIRYDVYSRRKGQSNWQALNILGDLISQRLGL